MPSAALELLPAASETSSLNTPQRASNSIAPATFGESRDVVARSAGAKNAPLSHTPPNENTNTSVPPPPNCVDADEAAARASDESWSMPRNAKYEFHLRSLMSFVHGRSPNNPYPPNTIFSRSQLLVLRPRHVCDWLSQRAFGRYDWSHERGDRPRFYRATSMEQSKKCISYFMPHKGPSWNEDGGNPTKHDAVSKLISIVRDYERRGEGAPVQGKAKKQNGWSAKPLPKKAKRKSSAIDESTDEGRNSSSDGTATCNVVAAETAKTNKRLRPLLGTLEGRMARQRPSEAEETSLRAPHRADGSSSTSAIDESPDEGGDSGSGGTATTNGGDLRSLLLGRLESLERATGELRAYIGEKYGALDEDDAVPARGGSADGSSANRRGSDESPGSSKRKEKPNEAGPAREFNAAACGGCAEELSAERRLSDQGRRPLNRDETNEAGSTEEIKTAARRGRPKGTRYHLAKGIKGATLSPSPRDLLTVWREYTSGLDGRKPARDFSRDDMRRMPKGEKQKFYRRNVVWRCMAFQIRSGLTPEQAADQLYGVYGIKTCVTKISMSIVADRRRYGGYHPDLLLVDDSPARGGRVEAWVNQDRRLLKQNELNEANAAEEIGAATLSKPRDILTLWREYTSGLNGRKPARDFTQEDCRRLTKAEKQTYYRRNVVWQCMASQIASGLAPKQAAERLYQVYGIKSCITKISRSIVADRRMYGDYHPDLFGAGPAEKINAATLSLNPRDLLTLWREYTSGLDGRKPARDFDGDDWRRMSKAERQRFYRRNATWQCMALQVESGVAPEVAADRLYDVYGSKTSLMKINNSIVADRSRYRGYYNPRLMIKDKARVDNRCFEEPSARQHGSDQDCRLLKQNESSEAAPAKKIKTATLSPMPRHLLTVWREYVFGLDGRKPAKDFDKDDMRRLLKTKKHIFYRRNVIWKCMALQIGSGLTPEQAADQLYGVYGSKTCVTKISGLIAADIRKYGGYHPDLSVK